MSKKDLIEGITEDIIDVQSTEFSYSTTQTPPNTDDQGLSYERGVQKKGKLLETCVLFVDIRNSVALTKEHGWGKMGAVYTAFAKAVIKAAHYHNGSVRNIIGDRVMVVFPTENCFTDAVDCAITINHALNIVMANEFSDIDFKCGIGIDYGELRVIKVGVSKHGAEKYENRGLVWVGDPANIASRLTDAANKKIEETYFEVTRKVFRRNTLTQQFHERTETKKVSIEEFIKWIDHGNKETIWINNFETMVSFSKKKIAHQMLPILMTEIVYEGFKAANSTRKDIVEKFWTESKQPVKDVNGKIYGGSVWWGIS